MKQQFLKQWTMEMKDSDPWETGSRWGEFPSLLPGGIVQATAQGGEPRQSLAEPLSWRDIAESLWRPEQLESLGQSTREERAAERTLVICRGSSWSNQQNIKQCICVRKLPKTGERAIQKGYREQGLALTQGGSSGWSNQEDWKHS